MGLLGGLTVLYLEDDRDTREMITLGLEREGARVLGTDSAQNAVLLFEQHQPHVIVADLELEDPELDGWMFMRAVRDLPSEHEKRTPAIAVSVHNEPGDRAKAGTFSHKKAPRRAALGSSPRHPTWRRRVGGGRLEPVA